MIRCLCTWLTLLPVIQPQRGHFVTMNEIWSRWNIIAVFSRYLRQEAASCGRGELLLEQDSYIASWWLSSHGSRNRGSPTAWGTGLAFPPPLFWDEKEPSPLLLRPLLAYCTSPRWWRWVWSNWWNAWQGKRKFSEKTCSSAALSTTNPTWPDQGSNPGHRGGKPATNRISFLVAKRS
jgi:hypothetical protein